ncbi:MAG: hypothetical protein SGARI_004935 [Bacillariaceae sp.]
MMQQEQQQQPLGIYFDGLRAQATHSDMILIRDDAASPPPRPIEEEEDEMPTHHDIAAFSEDLDASCCGDSDFDDYEEEMAPLSSSCGRNSYEAPLTSSISACTRDNLLREGCEADDGPPLRPLRKASRDKLLHSIVESPGRRTKRRGLFPRILLDEGCLL